MVARCPSCGSVDIDTDGARGDAVCRECGKVLEESVIVSEVSFVESAAGQSSVVGQFVSAAGVKSYGTPAAIAGFGKISREVTVENGRRGITYLSSQLRLGHHHSEAAQRLFLLAVQHNFIQGRRTIHVAAACLYVVCRREKTPHMLIDFSDALQTNVFVLGHTFLKFIRLLNLSLPIIDPSLYIHRFASLLGFGQETHRVAVTALRLVSRMKRDWMTVGRQPLGICAAGLFIAARIHGFRHTQAEILTVVHVCQMTLHKRLKEFHATGVTKLTFSEFEDVDEKLPEHDPPSFTRAREKEKSQMLLEHKQHLEEKARLAEGGEEAEDFEAEDLRKKARLEEEMGAALVSMESTEKHVSSGLTTTGGKVESTSRRFREREREREPTLLEGRKELPAPDDETLSDISDSEIDWYIATEKEAEMKKRLWDDIFLEYMSLKKEREGQKPAGGPRKRRKKPIKEETPADSAFEATTSALESKKLSGKVNYSALNRLLNPSLGELKSLSERSIGVDGAETEGGPKAAPDNAEMSGGQRRDRTTTTTTKTSGLGHTQDSLRSSSEAKERGISGARPLSLDDDRDGVDGSSSSRTLRAPSKKFFHPTLASERRRKDKEPRKRRKVD